MYEPKYKVTLYGIGRRTMPLYELVFELKSEALEYVARNIEDYIIQI